MANGVSTNSRVTFTMFSDVQTAVFNFTSLATGSNQVGEVKDIALTPAWTYLNTQSLSDVRWATFVNEGSGSIAVRISGSTTNIVYLKDKKDGSLVSMQSGSLPALMAQAYTSASILTYKLQES